MNSTVAAPTGTGSTFMNTSHYFSGGGGGGGGGVSGRGGQAGGSGGFGGGHRGSVGGGSRRHAAASVDPTDRSAFLRPAPYRRIRMAEPGRWDYNPA